MNNSRPNIINMEAAKQRQKDQKLLLVLAGTYDEYLRFRDSSRRRMREINNVHELYGMKGTDIVKIGSWYNREDVDEINQAITANRLNEVKP